MKCFFDALCRFFRYKNDSFTLLIQRNNTLIISLSKAFISIGRQKPYDLQLDDSSVDAIHINLLKRKSLPIHRPFASKPSSLNGATVHPEVHVEID